MFHMFNKTKCSAFLAAVMLSSITAGLNPAHTALAASNTEPSSFAYADSGKLMTELGSGATIKFGKKNTRWYVLGREWMSGANTVILRQSHL